MVALLAVGLVLVNVLGQGEKRVDKADAVATARARIDFRPSDYQIRFIRRGIPSHGYWVVSFYIKGTKGGYSRITVVVVDAASGRVTEVQKAK